MLLSYLGKQEILRFSCSNLLRSFISILNHVTPQLQIEYNVESLEIEHKNSKKTTKLGCYIAGLANSFKVCKMYQDSLTGSDPLQTNVYYLSSHLVLGMQTLPPLSPHEHLPDCQIASDTHLHKPFERRCLHFPSHYHHHLVSQLYVRLPAQIPTR